MVKHYFLRKRLAVCLVVGSVCLPLVLTGCWTGPRTFLHPEADMEYYSRLAILPFKNLAKDRYAGDKLMECLIPELLISEKFEVVEPGEVVKTLAVLNSTGDKKKNKKNRANGALDLTQAKLLGEKLAVQGIFIGTVREYEMVRIGTEMLPLISISLRLLDVQAGKVVWMATYTKEGGAGVPLLGYGRALTLSQLSQQVCRTLIGSLIREGF